MHYAYHFNNKFSSGGYGTFIFKLFYVPFAPEQLKFMIIFSRENHFFFKLIQVQNLYIHTISFSFFFLEEMVIRLLHQINFEFPQKNSLRS